MIFLAQYDPYTIVQYDPSSTVWDFQHSMVLLAQYDPSSQDTSFLLPPPNFFCRRRNMKCAKSSKTGPCKVSRLYDLISGGKRPLKVSHFQKCGISNGRLPSENRSYSRETWWKPVLDDSAHFVFWSRFFWGGGAETGPHHHPPIIPTGPQLWGWSQAVGLIIPNLKS